MDYDKLIERLRKEAYGSDIEDLLLDASTAIETLWADLARMTAERERDGFKAKYIEAVNRACKLSKIVDDHGWEE